MLTEALERKYLVRIETTLQAASDMVTRVVPGKLHVEDNGGRNVITEVDRKVSNVLRQGLLEPGEGWLSEGDVDDLARLRHDVVWVVDPLDGTREFVDGIPNGAFPSALFVKGVAVVGGICNPASGELFLAFRNCGVTYNHPPAQVRTRTSLDGALSRQEYGPGNGPALKESKLPSGPWDRWRAS